MLINYDDNRAFTEAEAKNINARALEEQVTLRFLNTNNLSRSALESIDKSTRVHIQGPLTLPKYEKRHYYERNTYPLEDVLSILDKFEKLENQVNKNWTDLQKALFVYDKIASNIMPNIDKEVVDDNQNLQIMNKGNGVCAGYSSVFYEMMNRLNIPCTYIRGIAGDSKHAWNVITIDGKNYPLDLTWEAAYRQKVGKNEIHYFGNRRDFSSNHVPDSDEPQFELSMLSSMEIRKAFDEINKSCNYDIITRKDDSEFLLYKLGEVDAKGKQVYKYAYSSYANERPGKTSILYSGSDVDKLDENGKLFFYNSLLDDNRINKYSKEGQIYVGDCAKVDGVYTKCVYHDYDDLLNNKAKSYTRDNNSNIVVSDTNMGKDVSGVNAYEATEFVYSKGQTYLKNDVVYTKDNLLEPKKAEEDRFIANDILERDTIDLSKNYNGGYVGESKSILGRYYKKVDKNLEATFERQEAKRIS